VNDTTIFNNSIKFHDALGTVTTPTSAYQVLFNQYSFSSKKNL